MTVLVPLGDLVQRVEAGKSLLCQSRPANLDEWGVVKVSAMTYGTFRENQQKALPPETSFDARHEIHAGDLLLSRANTTDYVGASVLVGAVRAKLLLSDKSLRLVPRDGVDVRWLHLMLLSPPVRSAISARASGTKDSMRNISQRALLQTEMPLVPIDEQHRIVAVLEDQLSRLDAGRSYLDAAAMRGERLWPASLDVAVTGEWASLRLEELLAEPPANGRSVPDGEGAPVLRLTALRSGTVDVSARKLGRWRDEEAHPFLIRQGDLLLARGNGSRELVGRAAIVAEDPPPVAFPDTMIRLRPAAEVIAPSLLLLVWNSALVRRQIEALVRTTAGIYKVNQKQLLDVRVPVPPRHLQSVMLADLQKAQQDANRLATFLNAGMRRGDALRRSLLTAAFSGRL